MNLRERSHSIKLSDDELVNQFDRKSLNEKLELFKRVLRKSHQTFSDLIKAWIHDTPGDNCHGPLRQRKAKQIVDLIWQDENGLLPLFEKTESFNERVATSTVKVIRSELDVLNTSVKAFGRFGGDNLPNVRDLRPIGAVQHLHPFGSQRIDRVHQRNPDPGSRCFRSFKREYAFRNDRPQSTTNLNQVDLINHNCF